MRLIFILSLPRSGSTLLQRVVSVHPKISTTSEPWLQLPLANFLRNEHVYTDYSHTECRRAIRDLINQLPEKEEDFYKLVNKFSIELYSKLSDEQSIYFLDKTPRYHLICDLLPKIFPDAKFLILWRNPLAVASSIIRTWGEGKWNLYRYKVDLYKGVKNLVDFKKSHKNIFCVNYEELVKKDAGLVWEEVFNYLELEYDPEYLAKFSDVHLEGTMGDPKREKFDKVVDHSSKWTESFDNFMRVYWAKKYLKWIGKENLEEMNYNYDQLLKSVPNTYFSKYLPSDIKAFFISFIKPWIESGIFRAKLNASKAEDIFNHN